jgi:high-affinity iron transporter
VIASFIITFRETLEAALVVGIVLSYLVNTQRTQHNKVVYLGVASAIVVSLIGAYLFNVLAGGFEGRAEQIFEGASMLFAVIMLTYMILWMMNQKHIATELHQKVEIELNEQHKVGLFLVVFASVLREGIETVIFLGATTFVSAGQNNILGALLGIATAIIIAYFIFIAGKKINIKIFFNVTSVFLILFAAGLVSSSIHEFQEAGILPEAIEHVWNINTQVNSDGTFPLMHQEGSIGSILNSLVGYDASPSLLQFIGYLAYISLIMISWINIRRIHKII